MSKTKNQASARIQTTMRMEKNLLKSLGEIARAEPGKYRSRSHLIEVELWAVVKKHRKGAAKKVAHDVLG